MVLETIGLARPKHRTWAGTYHSRPALLLKPTTVEEVQLIVREAKKANKKVTMVGAGHSPSILTMSDNGWLVSLDNLAQIIEYKSNKGYTDVVVEAGVRLYTLNEVLATRGLALQNLGSISEQSVAGVISTGTHGSSAFHGLICEQFVELEIVTANGELIKCSDTENREIFRGALLAFGKLGVIVRATLRVVPAFNLECRQEVMDFEQFVDEVYPSFFTSAEFHRVWWYPYTDKVVMWRANRTEKYATEPPYSFYGTRLGRFVYEALLWFSVRFAPHWTPKVETWLFKNQIGLENTYNTENATHAVCRSDKGINMDCLFSQFVNEWALPATNGPKVLREIKAAILEHKFYVHAPFEIRCSNTTLPEVMPAARKGAVVAGVPNVGTIFGNVTRPLLDTSPKLPHINLSEVTLENLTLNLNATMYRPFGFDSPTRDWFNLMETVCDKYGGKPHWAKNFIGTSSKGSELHHMAGLSDDIDRWYGEDVETWRNLRRRMDPDNLFVNNEWLEINGLE